MRTLKFLLIKEFKQIFRNKGMLPIIFAMPIIQLLILANAADYEIKHINLLVVDQDQSSLSRRLIGHFDASAYFNLEEISLSVKDAYHQIEEDVVDLTLTIPPHFEKDIVRDGQAQLQLLVNAINGSKAGVATGYSQSIVMGFNQEITEEFASRWMKPVRMDVKGIEVESRYWFNPDLNYKAYMVPGILVLLVTMIGAFLTSINIVREKEIGTIEQINVTPIRKHHFILGKMIPFWLIALFDLAFGLVLAKVAFNIPMVGSIIHLFLFAGIYLFLVLGLGLFISTITETQQQAMFLSWFIMVIFLLMGGLFTPIENMPEWARTMTYFNPIRYFIEVNRMVLLKGAGLYEIRYHFLIIIIFALVMNALAVLNYRKTV